MRYIVPIVEGRGEQEAVTVMLRRILQERFKEYTVDIAQPRNALCSSNLTKPGGLEAFLERALTVPSCCGIIVITDSDEACPVILARELASRARTRQAKIPIAVVCPHHEYESWILASWDSLRGRTIKGGASIRADISPQEPVETIRNPKAWLAGAMTPTYKPTLHQASLTQLLDFSIVETRSRSFRRLCNGIRQILSDISGGQSRVSPE